MRNHFRCFRIFYYNYDVCNVCVVHKMYDDLHSSFETRKIWKVWKFFGNVRTVVGCFDTSYFFDVLAFVWGLSFAIKNAPNVAQINKTRYPSVSQNNSQNFTMRNFESEVLSRPWKFQKCGSCFKISCFHIVFMYSVF